MTDRPGFTDPSTVIGRGVVQLETGLTLARDGVRNRRSMSLQAPEALVRIGVGNGVELRFSGTGFERTWTPRRAGSAVSGYSDVELGAKVRLLKHHGFAATLIPSVSIPTQDRHFSSHAIDPTLKFAWTLLLRNDVELSGNFNACRVSDGQAHDLQGAASVSVGHPLVEHWQAYGEMYTITAGDGPDVPWGWTADAGVTHPLGRHAQVDIEAGHGIGSDAPTWFVAFGVSIRHAPRHR